MGVVCGCGQSCVTCSTFVDVTRVLILDSTQNAALAEIVAGLLKDIGQEQAKIQFPVSAQARKVCVLL